MRETPDALALLDAVADFLRQEAAPGLAGQAGFHARVAANVLDIVRREMAGGGVADSAERARLVALLGHDGGNADTLNRELCARIAADQVGWDDPTLLDHLWRTTLETVAIDQPKYATYRRIVGESCGS